MTAIGVTDRDGADKLSTQAHDWKRRSERLVRASGRPYTIVRPSWFDGQAPDQHRMMFLQGDTRHAGNASDGVIARRQIAQVLIGSLSSSAAVSTTFELVAERGPAQSDLEPRFPALDRDDPGAWMASVTPRTSGSSGNRSGSWTISSDSGADVRPLGRGAGMRCP